VSLDFGSTLARPLPENATIREDEVDTREVIGISLTISLRVAVVEVDVNRIFRSCAESCCGEVAHDGKRAAALHAAKGDTACVEVSEEPHLKLTTILVF